ncbi:MAG: DUF2268 domain-containing putative Zn-dependent protease [Candidatus Nanohalobium sp.]
MQFEKYDPDEHSGYVKEWFAEASTTPDNLEVFRSVVETAIKDFDEVFGIEVDFDVVIAETDIETVRRERGRDANHYAYINGMGLTDDFEYFDRNLLVLRVTDTVDEWRSFLKSLAIHEQAHIKFHKERSKGKSIAYHLLMEGHAMHSDRKVSELKDYTWRQEWELPDIQKKKLLEDLDKMRSWNQPQSDEISVLFDYGTDPWPEAEGYALAFFITQDVMERNDLSVEDLLEISKKKWETELKKSIENLYEDE